MIAPVTLCSSFRCLAAVPSFIPFMVVLKLQSGQKKRVVMEELGARLFLLHVSAGVGGVFMRRIEYRTRAFSCWLGPPV